MLGLPFLALVFVGFAIPVELGFGLSGSLSKLGHISRTSLLYQVIAFEAVLLCGVGAAISLYLGLPGFQRAKPRWIAAAAAWAVVGVAGILEMGL